MLGQGQISRRYSYGSPLQKLRRRSRSVQVRVVDAGFEVDRFTVSDPKVLRAELRTIYRHLPKGQGWVQLSGIEEQWLPLGLDRTRQETHLRNSADALFYLAA